MLPPPVTVFAVEDRAVQLSWPGLPRRDMTLEVGDQRGRVGGEPPAMFYFRGRRPRPLSEYAFGPGAVTVDELEPGTAYDVCLSGPDIPRTVVARFTTLTPPPGRLLTRFATVGDVHLGERAFGMSGRIEDRLAFDAGLEPYPLRAVRAAIEEARTWGAELLVVKGDLTHNSRPVQFHQAGRLLAGTGIDTEVILGNHDVRRGADGVRLLAGYGITATTAPRVRDLPGARLVLGHTPHPAHHAGDFGPARADELAALVAAGERPAVVLLHHPPQRWPVPVVYPPGIPRSESTYLMAALRRTGRDLVLLSGHTHRYRRYTMDGITVAEVGSTKDYPGAWAGYAVHEGGIRQVVHRIARPDVLAWTDATKRTLFGQWGRWAPGQLSDRCWIQEWSAG